VRRAFATRRGWHSPRRKSQGNDLGSRGRWVRKLGSEVGNPLASFFGEQKTCFRFAELPVMSGRRPTFPHPRYEKRTASLAKNFKTGFGPPLIASRRRGE